MDTTDIVLHIGQQLLVRTASELLTGTLKFVDPKRKIIELDNVYDQRTNCRYNSSQILAFPQIKQIQIVSGYERSRDTQNIKETRQKNNVALTPAEMELINLQLNNLTCIAQTDQRYHKALEDIREQPILALVIEPSDYGRAQRTSVLAVATFKNVYIFDIIALGSIFRELKQVLEAERPRKVVHYSHRLVDQLKNRHGVILGAVFDTFVAASLVQGTKKPMTLLDSIEETLNITPHYFEGDAANHNMDPYKRPLSAEVCQVLAKKAIFQLKLYEQLLHTHMLKNFYDQCEKFSHTFCDSEDATTPLEMQRESRAGYQHIRRMSDEFAFKFNDLKLYDDKAQTSERITFSK